MNKFKRDSIAKVTKSINKYLKEIKPKFSKNFTETSWKKLCELLLGIIVGQSCFLNTVVENTPHYCKSSKKGELLNKNAQIDKLSNYLLLPFLNRFTCSYLSHLHRKYFSKCSLSPNKEYSIKERVHHQKLALHDTTDIQKPSTKKRRSSAIAETVAGALPRKQGPERDIYSRDALVFIRAESSLFYSASIPTQKKTIKVKKKKPRKI